MFTVHPVWGVVPFSLLFRQICPQDTYHLSSNNYVPGTVCISWALSMPWTVFSDLQALTPSYEDSEAQQGSIQSSVSHGKEREADQVYFVGTELLSPSTPTFLQHQSLYEGSLHCFRPCLSQGTAIRDYYYVQKPYCSRLLTRMVRAFVLMCS